MRAGRGTREPGRALGPAVELTSTYHAGGRYTYGRDENATWEALEEVLGALEGGTAVSFASGVAAIAAVLEQLPVGATVVAPYDAYSGTRRLLSDLSSRGRLAVRFVDTTDITAAVEACRGAGLLWIESPTNPLLHISDIAGLAAGARESGVTLVAADNTFATPLLQRPLELGVDVVVHSVTKLLSGHSDVVMGAAITGDAELALALSRRRSLHGAIPGALEAWLALRGVRTLPVRLHRAQANAAELAARLAGHPAVERVRYPGLPEHPGHELAVKQMRGFGAMVTFEVRGGPDAAEEVCNRVTVCVHATSLGGVETLIERRGKWAGEDYLPPALVRLSVGIEDVEDLWADLGSALAALD
ncbi:MAG TPA: aminotransferase class I/II-fold pyridoxal phosphate-dependent enzyme [Acidimicrobiales bacterium]|nr:aminotransferase class I/II-fold pyridoxal phosphate-dependent enzyme [Acidimicrobiales bacterium]